MCGSAGPRGISHGRLSWRFWLALSLLAVILAYRSILFDFFLGDDFVHLPWLKQAATDPRLVLANFYGDSLNSALSLSKASTDGASFSLNSSRAGERVIGRDASSDLTG
jgi:hypothetical protein